MIRLRSLSFMLHRIRAMYSGAALAVGHGPAAVWHLASQVFLAAHYQLLRRPRPTFSYLNKSYRYLVHPYNWTFKSERAVEVPVVAEAVRNAKGRVLEVGNVLAHYFPVHHTVIDKYERAPGTINIDVIDYRPSEYYDLIVTISTLEHVGWDEVPRDPSKVSQAITHLTSLLAPGGQLLATIPLGHHPQLDSMLLDPAGPFPWRVFMRRRSARNDWSEIPIEDARGAVYDSPFMNADVVCFARLERPALPLNGAAIPDRQE